MLMARLVQQVWIVGHAESFSVIIETFSGNWQHIKLQGHFIHLIYSVELRGLLKSNTGFMQQDRDFDIWKV